MAKFMMQETLGQEPFTSRLGSAANAGGNINNNEVGKFVKLVGESRYDLAVAGDKIEATIVATEVATMDGYSIGSCDGENRRTVVFDGLEATPGTGTVAVGDFVVVGTAVAKGTALTEAGPRVCKATNQPGTAVTSADNVVGNINAALAKMADAQKNLAFGWRVISLGSVGTGAVGTTGVIEEV